MARLLKWCARIGFYSLILGAISFIGCALLNVFRSSNHEFRWLVASLIIPAISFAMGTFVSIVLPLKRTRPENYWHSVICISGFLLIVGFVGWGVRLETGYWSLRGDRTAHLDSDGRVVFGKGMNDAPEVSEGFVTIEQSWWWYHWQILRKKGFADNTGQITIHPQFDSVRPFHDGMAVATMNGKNGVIDRHGEWIVPPEYDWIGILSEGLFDIRRDGRAGYLDVDGKIRIPLQFENASWFSEGYAAVKINGKWGFIDHDGQIAIKPQFDQTGEFHEGLASVNIGGTYGVRPEFGAVEIGFRGGKWGVVDKQGTVIVKPQFDRVYAFQHGIAEVEINGENRFINAHGEFVDRDK